jgi:hypothetical protein
LQAGHTQQDDWFKSRRRPGLGLQHQSIKQLLTLTSVCIHHLHAVQGAHQEDGAC